MGISLYDISVTSYLQTLGAVAGYLDRGSAHCEANGIDLDEIVETRLHPDMLPFRFQIVSVAHHSLGSINGIESGTFRPPAGGADLDYASLLNLVADARAGLLNYTRETVDAMEGKEVLFEIGDRKLPFTAENFVMSFSLTNLYFHATTAYDILRMKGVQIGKRDYIGQLRIKK
jgi:uncharacterized protein